jgi:diadenosine tetraphosphate (Ap4A) HIT family hydrolase
MRTEKCPFCDIREDQVIAEDRNVIAIADEFPVANGHTLVIPKEHVRSVFQLNTNESADLWGFVIKVRQLLADRFKPDGFSIGINDGDAAGQTISHGHSALQGRCRRSPRRS